MHFFSRLGLAVTSLATTATARLVSFSPSTSGGPSYRVGIPTGSTISSTAPGPIYFSLTAPSTYQWVGLGIGEQMAGAHIFVMYADGSGGNVTLSARDGNQGHVEPQFNSTLASGVELLEGSGVAHGVMTANVRCTTCYLLSSGTSTSSPWIAAWMPGGAINSDSDTFVIAQHSPDATSQFTFDLSQAGLASDTNPFVAASSTSPSASTSSGGAAAPTSSSGSNRGSSQTVDGATVAATVAEYQKAHGIIMGVTVTLLFPLGASVMRLGGGWVIHMVVQLFSLACLIVGFGLGVKLADLTGLLYANHGRTHTIFGTVIFVLFLLQPLGGLIHHMLYKRTGGRTPVSHVHIWLGRVVLIGVIINGGLGLRLATNTTGGEIAYGVVAGVVALAYTVLVVFKRKSPRGARGAHGNGLVEKHEHASSGGGSPVRPTGDAA